MADTSSTRFNKPISTPQAAQNKHSAHAPWLTDESMGQSVVVCAPVYSGVGLSAVVLAVVCVCGYAGAPR
eukprot:13854875-Alexandrium_andersonii.AAC.1